MNLVYSGCGTFLWLVESRTRHFDIAYICAFFLFLALFVLCTQTAKYYCYLLLCKKNNVLYQPVIRHTVCCVKELCTIPASHTLHTQSDHGAHREQYGGCQVPCSWVSGENTMAATSSQTVRLVVRILWQPSTLKPSG